MADELRILILEDNENDLMLMERELFRGGIRFTSRHVKTRREFQSELTGFNPDIILSDYRLSGYNAMKALLLAQRLKPEVPFIIITDSLSEVTAVECMKAGADDCIPKEHIMRLALSVTDAVLKRSLRQEREQAVAARESMAALRSRAVTMADEASRWLTEQLAFTHAITTCIGDGVLVVNSDSIVTFVNPAAERILGWESRELIGRQAHGTIFRHPGERPEDAGDCPLLAVMSTGHPLSDREDIFRRKAGPPVIVSLSGTPLILNDTPAGVVVAFHDITERKQLEEKLRQSHKMEAVGLLAGGVAHDFNNILTAIIGFSHLLVSRSNQGDMVRTFATEILTASERAAELTQSLLAFSRKQDLSQTTVDLNTIVRNARKFLSRVIGEDIELQFVVANEPLTIFADKTQIEQILLNLATNARDAMPDGGIVLVKTGIENVPEDCIRCAEYGTPGVHACLVFSDTGIGMDHETSLKIFDPFYTTKEAGRGTGLGLAMTYGIVKQHGGHISVSSTQGKGTTFRIHFPLMDIVSEDRCSHKTPEPAGGTETILVAEDQQEVRELLSLILGNYGYNTLTASDGKEAVDIFTKRSEEIDLAILDVVMPGMSGQSAYEQIKRLNPAVRVLFMSGYHSDIVLKKGLIPAGIPLIPKPVTPVNLLRIVREILDS